MKKNASFFDIVMETDNLKSPLVTRWIQILGHVPEWSDMTDDNITAYANMLKQETLNPKGRLDKFKYLLDKYKSIIPSKNYAEILSYKRDFDCKTFALSYIDMESLVNYEPTTQNEGFVWRVFVIQMYTGARYDDALKITSENIVGDHILYKNKDGVDISVPLNQKAVKAIYSSFTVNKSFAGKHGQYMTTLRSMFKKIGLTSNVLIRYVEYKPMNEAVIPDTALCTFATRLYHDGFAPQEIMQYMGLKTLKGVRTHIYGYNKRKRKDSNLFTK